MPYEIIISKPSAQNVIVTYLDDEGIERQATITDPTKTVKDAEETVQMVEKERVAREAEMLDLVKAAVKLSDDINAAVPAIKAAVRSAREK